jgi:hypothetical protein
LYDPEASQSQQASDERSPNENQQISDFNEESEERENGEESYDVEIVEESYEDEMEEDYESLASENEVNK